MTVPCQGESPETKFPLTFPRKGKTMSHSQQPQETYASFMTKFGQVLAQIYAGEESRTRVAEAFRVNGLPTPKVESVSGGTEVKFTVDPEPESTYIAEGITLGDLTTAARTAREAGRLASARRQAYLWFQAKVRNQRLTVDEVRPHLEQLGLPLPTVKTCVEAAVWQDGKRVSLNFVLDEHVSREDVQAKLDEINGKSPQMELVHSVFPQAESRQGVSEKADVYVEHRTSWPSFTS